ETICRRGEGGDQPVTIRALKRFVMEKLGHDYRLPPVQVNKSQTIAIVGGGPTGLTAAQDLAEAGYEVHVYEKGSRLGGMMYVIPEWRLTRSALDNDITRLLEHCPGIKVHLNSGLGDEVSLEELKKRHDAVLLAVGLWKDRRLGVPGEGDELEGLYGIDLLVNLSHNKPTMLKGKVVVVGGGNVAMDTARTALRLEAQEVQLYCLENRKEMPAFSYEIDQAEEEGVIINNSWGPKQILTDQGRVTGVEFMRCLSVFDSEGRFNPSYNPNETLKVDADSVLVSIGLQVECSELDGLNMMDRGLVKSDFENMRTADPKVFSAGDGSFGPSAVVYAMHHGHKAAYFIKAFLEGLEKPLPYKTPWRTRQLPLPQDPAWETLPREEQAFHGIDLTCPFPRLSQCESAFDLETAKRQAARCYRCDAETGSAQYQRRDREHIHMMAKIEPGDTAQLRTILLGRLRPRDNPFPEDRPGQLDDIHFLPAALTRLVIDPYREACATKTMIGKWLELDMPYFVTGFDQAPIEIRRPLAESLRAQRCGYIGGQELISAAEAKSSAKLPWLQLLVAGDSEPRADADGLVHVIGREFQPIRQERLHEKQMLGLAVAAPALEKAIPYALEQGYDLLILDGTEGIEKPWVELRGAPDITVMRDAIRILREHNSEEKIALLYFGGLRSGTDVAKTIAINCNAGIFSVAPAIAMSGLIEGNHSRDCYRYAERRQDKYSQPGAGGFAQHHDCHLGGTRSSPGSGYGKKDRILGSYGR
ncbi:MAG: FAD-dependent oxidoreductase, partial [Deltaproteobacteria bacterium]